MAGGRITKRVVNSRKPQACKFAVWDAKLSGFGVRVRPGGAMSYVVVYRAGSGRGAPARRYTIASRQRRQDHTRSRQRASKGHPRSSGAGTRSGGTEGYRTRRVDGLRAGPWEAVSRRAGLDGVRLHHLRHTYASFGAGSGLGLPIIGKLLGHTQAATTHRYAHLDADPLRRASEAIGGRIAAALDGKRGGSVVRLKGVRRG